VFNTPMHDSGRPNLKFNNVTMSDLERMLEHCDLAILPDVNDYHQDHANTFHLAFPWLSKNAKEIWSMKSVPYAHYHLQNSANLFVDISAQWAFKKSLLQCYNSYLTDTHIKDIETSNQYWGQRNNASHAEAFTIIQKNA
jgi:LmbE family N-acetylglucosaminyl deacetylase